MPSLFEEERDLGGVPAFSVGPVASSTVLVIGCDVFGWHTAAARDLARRLAAGINGRVILPDTIGPNGPPITAFVPEEFPAWLAAHNADATNALVARVLAAAKAEAPAGATFVGSGFCWGALQVLDAAAAGHLHGFSVAHPSRTTPEMYAAASRGGAPGLVIRADKDGYDDAAAAATAAACPAPAHDVTFCGPWVGAGHGFAIRGDDADAVVGPAKQASIDATVAFVKRVAAARAAAPAS